LSSNATETAQALATVVSSSAWPQEAVRDLARLLGHGLASPTPAQLREARLGLLIELVSVGTGEFIDTDTYDTARERRVATGEECPTASGLARAYGHWLIAVRAAMRFWFIGGSARVPADHSHVPAGPAYTPAEAIEALNVACEDLRCEVITEWEYEEWRRLRRTAARHAGTPLPRFPSMTPIRKHFGGFDQALRQARAQRTRA
jgi:hypothetical protein